MLFRSFKVGQRGVPDERLPSLFGSLKPRAAATALSLPFRLDPRDSGGPPAAFFKAEGERRVETWAQRPLSGTLRELCLTVLISPQAPRNGRGAALRLLQDPDLN